MVLKAVILLLEQQFLRTQRGSEPEVGKAGEGLGAAAGSHSAILPSGCKLQGSGIPVFQVVAKVYLTVC